MPAQRPSKKRTKKRVTKRSRQKATWSWGGWLRRLALFGVLVAVAGVVWLDLTIRSKFEGRRWSIPAHVYSRPLELYSGLKLTLPQLTAELASRGYRASPAPQVAGSYSVGESAIGIATRDFVFWDGKQPARQVQVEFDTEQLRRITDATTQAAVPVLRLDPRLIGSVSPVHHEDRSLVRLEDVPEQLLTALLLIEDRNFTRHFGIDPRGLARAMWVNLRAGGVVQGGSTITQQLVKNFYLTADRTLRRKLIEMAMAILLEFHYEKHEILEAYVNEVFLGQAGRRAIHGFGLASQFHFGRPLRELTVPEIALLVGMVRAPSYYNPRRKPEQALARRNVVLDKLAENGHIDAAELAAAKRSSLGVTDVAPASTGDYPAFMDFVRRQLRRDYREDDLRSAGLSIITTIDPEIQGKAERALKKRLAGIESERAIVSGTLQGAIIVLRPDNGEVLAVVGDRAPTFAGFNRVLDARRPIGSLVKPAVYLAALNRSERYSLATMVDDAPVYLKQAGSAAWQPQNYDKQFHGPVPLISALSRSYNAATARLGLEIGVDVVADTMRALGIERDIQRFPSLLLGATNLTPVEVAQMYQTLANGGFRAPLRSILSVLSENQRPLARYPLDVQQVIDSEPAYLINFALQQVVLDGTARSLQSRFPATVQLAGKTGTTDEFRDSWFAGYSGNLLAVVWVGRDDNKPTGLSGASGAMRVWSDMMQQLSLEPLVLNMPQRIDMTMVDPVSGLRADASCAEAIELPLIEGSGPREYADCASSASGDEVGQRVRGWFGRLLDRIERRRHERAK
ncbi:MAG: penicillin-binding protein 1B [Gammaproteobacteria bacterium]|nr:penicillin-binding protein 1B [Gammaproteobacteria bacterium]MDH3465785.1 penicillin-binding protein 1B [Gammaproteobacteria bacterium]